MSTNPQSQAIQIVNQLIANSQQLMTLYQSMVTLDQQWTDDAAANTIAAMSTVTLNSDGSPGTADGSPNVAHPISPTTYPSLSRLISSNQIAQLKTILDGIVNYVGGSAVSTQASARPILNVAVGG